VFLAGISYTMGENYDIEAVRVEFLSQKVTEFCLMVGRFAGT